MDVNYRRKRFLDVNSKNLEDKTAWDMLQEDNKEIRVMLRRVGANRVHLFLHLLSIQIQSTKGCQHRYVFILFGLRI